MNLPISTMEAIKGSDFNLTNGVRQIKALDLLKAELHRQAKHLTRALNASCAQTADDLVHVPGGLVAPNGSNPRSVQELEAQHKTERTWKRVQKMAAGLDFNSRKAVFQRIHSNDLFRLVEVEAKLQQIVEREAAIQRVIGTVLMDLKSKVRLVSAVPV